jgi:signal transduction histidine kinase
LRRTSRSIRLRHFADQVLEVPDVDGLTRLLTEALPVAAGVTHVALLLWDRKLEAFQELPSHGTRAEPPRARSMISDGQLLDTNGNEDGVLIPLMARSGLVGILFLGPRHGRRARRYRPAEVHHLSAVAARSALAFENHLYQREVIASERMAALGTMAGMLAHDFRGPMTVIRGYAETLLEGSLPPAEVQERADLIIKMVDRLERMTAETLDFARESHRLVRRNVNLASMLHELAEGIPLELPGLEVDTDIRLPPGIQASLDVDKLRRAVGNIAANARDAMKGSGRLHIRAEVRDGVLFLTIVDEGPGVPEGIRERLFEPFVTQGKKGGTGLGLAVARRFVEDHGGTVELLPEGPGARFRILLPLAPSV